MRKYLNVYLVYKIRHLTGANIFQIKNIYLHTPCRKFIFSYISLKYCKICNYKNGQKIKISVFTRSILQRKNTLNDIYMFFRGRCANTFSSGLHRTI